MPQAVHLRDKSLIHADKENQPDSQQYEQQSDDLHVRHRPDRYHSTKSTAQTEEQRFADQIINISQHNRTVQKPEHRTNGELHQSDISGAEQFVRAHCHKGNQHHTRQTETFVYQQKD